MTDDNTDDMIDWTLRNNRGYPNVDGLKSPNRDEILVALKAANTMHPEGAPHHATTEGGERFETEETMPREEIEAAISNVEDPDAS